MFKLEISESMSVTWLVLGDLVVVLAEYTVNVLPLFDPGPDFDVELVLTPDAAHGFAEKGST
jgi:hypothetical protein